VCGRAGDWGGCQPGARVRDGWWHVEAGAVRRGAAAAISLGVASFGVAWRRGPRFLGGVGWCGLVRAAEALSPLPALEQLARLERGVPPPNGVLGRARVSGSH
jgi:hypothetical protein